VSGADRENFHLLVHGHNDIVSDNLISTGKWEADHLAAIEDYHNKHGTITNSKRFLDIGANLGYFTLIAAKRGYQVTAFEAMKLNAKMVNVSICVSQHHSTFPHLYPSLTRQLNRLIPT